MVSQTTTVGSDERATLSEFRQSSITVLLVFYKCSVGVPSELRQSSVSVPSLLPTFRWKVRPEDVPTMFPMAEWWKDLQTELIVSTQPSVI